MAGASANFLGLSATDLGLGDLLSKQRDDQTEEEKRKRQMGMSVRDQAGGMNFGMTGIASVDLLGMGKR